jgi:hypothetical protein
MSSTESVEFMAWETDRDQVAFGEREQCRHLARLVAERQYARRERVDVRRDVIGLVRPRRADDRMFALQLNRAMRRRIAEHDGQRAAAADVVEQGSCLAASDEDRHPAPVGGHAAAVGTGHRRRVVRVARCGKDRHATLDKCGVFGVEQRRRFGSLFHAQILAARHDLAWPLE